MLIEISRVTKRSIYWLLTGEVRRTSIPFRFLDAPTLHVILKIASNAGWEIEKVVDESIAEAMEKRVAERNAQRELIGPKEYEELRLMFAALMMGDEEFEEQVISAAPTSAILQLRAC